MIGLTTWVFLALFAAAATLAVTMAVVRFVMTWLARRRQRRAEPARRRLIGLMADVDPVEQAEALVALPEASWNAVEPTAMTMLEQVRGEAHAALADVFVRRGLVSRARDDLTAGSAVRRARAAELLGQLRRFETVAGLCHLLADNDAEVRLVAVRALGRLGDPDAAEPLLGALTGARPAPSHVVAHALVGLGTPAAPALLAALDHDDDLVRATALDALRLLGVPAAADAVARTLRQDPSLEVRRRAATTLGRIGRTAAVPHLLAAAARDQPTVLRADAVAALGELGSPGSVADLAGLVDDDSYPVAHRAARALLRLGGPGRDALADAAASARPGAAHAAEALAIDAIGASAADPVAARS
jgi:HEAT repeat protein